MMLFPMPLLELRDNFVLDSRLHGNDKRVTGFPPPWE